MKTDFLGASVFSRLNANKTRTILIILSLTIAIICLTVSGFISYLLVERATASFKNTSENTVFMNVDSAEVTYSNVEELGEFFTASTYNFFSEKSLWSSGLKGKSYSFNMLSVGKLQEKMILPSADQYGATEYSRLIAGRLINENDILLNRNAILIHDAIGKFLFEEGSNIIGEKIDFDGSGTVYEIVGILSNTPDILRVLEYYTIYETEFSTGRFKIPIITYNNTESTRVSKLLIFFDGRISLDTLQSMQTTILNNSNYQSVRLTTAESEKRSYTYVQAASSQTLDLLLTIVTIILCLISIIIIYITIKERASEIGIRKSFGATTPHVIAMFLSEILSCIFTSIGYALPISTLIMTFIVATSNSFINILIFPINFDIYLFPSAIIAIAVCFVSLAPLIIYGKSKIVNLLRVS